MGTLAQGTKHREKGTDTIKFSHPKQVPKGQTATYIRIVVDTRPNKKVKERVRPTIGGDKVDYQGDVTTCTADLTTIKMHLNSTISTPDAKFMRLDLKNFYLNTPLDEHMFAHLAIKYIPKQFMDEYNIWDLVVNGYVYMEVMKGMYGLPQAGRLANLLLRKGLAPHGIHECKHTPGLWRHAVNNLAFTLWVDDFGIRKWTSSG